MTASMQNRIELKENGNAFFKKLDFRKAAECFSKALVIN
jgi:hypothetical protein